MTQKRGWCEINLSHCDILLFEPMGEKNIITLISKFTHFYPATHIYIWFELKGQAILILLWGHQNVRLQ
jgi:hypothetical protein